MNNDSGTGEDQAEGMKGGVYGGGGPCCGSCLKVCLTGEVQG